MTDAETTDGDQCSHISFEPKPRPAGIIAADEARAAPVGETVH